MEVNAPVAEVRLYKPEDFPAVSSWAKAWEINVSEDLLPHTGFIVPDVAAFFIYETDSKVCYFENLICNPSASREQRESAFSGLTQAVIQEAKSRGFKVAYACTNIGSVINLAIQSGAHFKPKYVLLTKDLS